MTLKYNCICLTKIQRSIHCSLLGPKYQESETEDYMRQQFCTRSYDRQLQSRNYLLLQKFLTGSKYLPKDKYPCVYVGADRLWNIPYGFHFKKDKWKWSHYIIWSGNMLLKSNLVFSTYFMQLHHKKLSSARAPSFSGGARNGRYAPKCFQAFRTWSRSVHYTPIQAHM